MASSGLYSLHRRGRAARDGDPVADVTAAVVDTHPLLFHAGGWRLGRRAAATFDAAERRAAVLYVPVAVIGMWSARVCAAARRLDLPLITRDAAIVESKLVRVLW